MLVDRYTAKRENLSSRTVTPLVLLVDRFTAKFVHRFTAKLVVCFTASLLSLRTASLLGPLHR